MSTLVTDPDLSASLIHDRQARGIADHDEVWEGVYVMVPAPNDEHQDIVGGLAHLLREMIDNRKLGKSRPGVNVSDRVDDWSRNYRCPDMAVFLNETTAEFHDTFWLGGPDFAVEIISPGDQTREKIEFYEKVGTRELLIIDRDPWQLELYRLAGKQLVVAGKSDLRDPTWLASETVSLKWRLQPGSPRPQIEVQTVDTKKAWCI